MRNLEGFITKHMMKIIRNAQYSNGFFQIKNHNSLLMNRNSRKERVKKSDGVLGVNGK